MTVHTEGMAALDPHDLTAIAGGSPISYALGYAIGFVARLIVEADPFDGNYYGVGA